MLFKSHTVKIVLRKRAEFAHLELQSVGGTVRRESDLRPVGISSRCTVVGNKLGNGL